MAVPEHVVLDDDSEVFGKVSVPEVVVKLNRGYFVSYAHDVAFLNVEPQEPGVAPFF